MFRYTIRTCRCLARRQINTRNALVNRYSSCISILPLDFHRVENSRREFSVSTYRNYPSEEELVRVSFDEACDETLESLCEYFEELIEAAPDFKGADVIYGDGVLTVALGPKYGTYVINRQKPNKQIWLSSPTSGPKRYDLVPEDGGYWIYKHDGVTLHKLLQEEISKLTVAKVDFTNCSHCHL